MAVDESVCWYDDICSLHGIGTGIVDGLWSSHGAPPPLHSAAKSVEPAVMVRQVLDAVEPLEHCSVADSFCSLGLEGEGMAVLFHASWVHREPDLDGPPSMPPGWRPLSTVAELADWTGAVGVSDVFDLDNEGGDWDEVVRVVQACYPGRPIVGYEWGAP